MIQQLLDLGKEKAPIVFIQVTSFKTEWIFGQTFDEHQDKFVTLNNRNFTKMILEKFDNEAKYEQRQSEDDSEKDDVVDEQIDSGPPLPQKQSHSRIITELKEI